ncbi:MAG: T9SS type A sorting domain-containing protein [Chitinophagales bacterium]
MEKLTRTFPSRYLQHLCSVVLICIVSFSNNIYAASDTTYFRIRVLQDSVYAGDTIDVEFYISSKAPGLSVLNLVKQFEMEIAADTSLLQQDKTQFAFDYASLATFFGTTLSNITAISALDPILGELNLKTSSSKSGGGDARVGQGQYIVQDNVAGRQSMNYNYTKASSKNLLGLPTPVKTITDSVLILGRRTSSGTQKSANPVSINNDIKIFPSLSNDVKIYPNPATGYVRVDKQDIMEIRLIGLDGVSIAPEIKLAPESIQLNMSDLRPGVYLLMLQTTEGWNSYKIIKE